MSAQFSERGEFKLYARIDPERVALKVRDLDEVAKQLSILLRLL